MALEWQRAVITRIAHQTPGVKSYFFSLAAPVEFRAGQHMDVRLTAEDGYQAQRSYSIASSPEGAHASRAENIEAGVASRDEQSGRGAEGVKSARVHEIELVIERLEDGEVSPFFHDVAAVGDEIELRGPIGGHFVWEVSDGGPVLLIGGGSGVVPLMSMIRHRAAQHSIVPVLLLFSARTWDDLIFRTELLALHSREDGFDLVLALTRESAATEHQLARGADYLRRVDAPMIREVLARLPGAPEQVFICGSNPFVEAAAQGAIAAGVPAAIIRTERFGG